MPVYDIGRARQLRKHRRLRGARGSLAFGLGCAPVGLVFAWLAFKALLEGTRPSIYSLIVVVVGAFTALFGISMSWQSARGEPTHHGFFIRWLAALGQKLSPAGVLLSVLALGGTALLVGLAFDRDSEITAGTSIILGWLAFHFRSCATSTATTSQARRAASRRIALSEAP